MCSTDNTPNNLLAESSSCACCAPAASSETSTATTAVGDAFLVEGMTCGHCVSSVTEELSELDGVEGVNVELVPGGQSKVTVASASPIDAAKVEAAIKEAGYTLAGRA